MLLNEMPAWQLSLLVMVIGSPIVLGILYLMGWIVVAHQKPKIYDLGEEDEKDWLDGSN